MSWRGAALLGAALFVGSCAPAAQRQPARWMCPGEDWVEAAAGGCGAAVQLCAEGAAAAGACDRVRWDEAHTRSDGTAGLWRSSDGALHGGWPEAGDPIGAPASVATEAGISMCPGGWARGAAGECTPELPGECAAGSGEVPSADPGQRCTRTSESQCGADEFPAVPEDAPAERRIVYVRAGAPREGADGTLAHPYPGVTAALEAHGTDPRIPVFLLARGDYEPTYFTSGTRWVVGRCPAYVRFRAEGASPALTISNTARVTLRGVRASGGAPSVSVLMGARASLERVVVEQSSGFAVGVQDRDTELTATDLYIADTAADPTGRKGFGLVAVGGPRVTLDRAHVVRSSESGVVSASTSRVTMRDSVVRETRGLPGGTQGNAVLAFGGVVSLERVLVRDSVGPGITATGANGSARAVDVQVRGVGSATRPSPGLYAFTMGVVSGDRVSVVESTGRALDAIESGLVEVREAVFDGLRTGGTGSEPSRTGACVFARNRGTIRAERMRCSRAQNIGVVAFGADARVELLASHVRDSGGPGLLVSEGASASCERSLIENARESGVDVSGPGVRADVTESTVRGTRSNADGVYGSGVSVLREAHVSLEGVLIEDNRHIGLGATTAGTIDATRVIVRNTRTDETGSGGVGLQAVDGGRMTLSRARFERNEIAGFSAHGQNSTLVLEDALVVGSNESNSNGAYVQKLAAVTLRRAAITDVAESALVLRSGADDPCSVEAEDLVVERVRPGMLGFGGALMAFGSPTVTARRVAVRDVYGAAFAAGPLDMETRPYGATVTLTDVDLRGVRESTVRLDVSPAHVRPTGSPVAYGLYAGPHSTLRAERVSVREAQYGFYLLQGTLEARDGLFARNRGAAGASTGARGPDALTLERVRREDNLDDAVQLDLELPETSALPPPSALCPAEGCGP